MTLRPTSMQGRKPRYSAKQARLKLLRAQEKLEREEGDLHELMVSTSPYDEESHPLRTATHLDRQKMSQQKWPGRLQGVPKGSKHLPKIASRSNRFLSDASQRAIYHLFSDFLLPRTSKSLISHRRYRTNQEFTLFRLGNEF